MRTAGEEEIDLQTEEERRVEEDEEMEGEDVEDGGGPEPFDTVSADIMQRVTRRNSEDTLYVSSQSQRDSISVLKERNVADGVDTSLGKNREEDSDNADKELFA